MINYIGKFLLVIFDIKKKPLCEERLLFYVSVPISFCPESVRRRVLDLFPQGYVCYFGCAKTITSAWHNRFLGMKRSLHRHETLVGLFLLVFRADDVPQFHFVADLLFCDPSQASGDFGAVLFHTEQIGGGDVRSIDFLYIILMYYSCLIRL